tara:strand:+ start:2675 stop:3490 length:816 start_codon:yes stop_codon:yes gene_type:complete
LADLIPIYEAIAYEDVQLTGGTTRPLVFSVMGDNIFPYVVKIFSANDNRQYYPISKECIAWMIANEFEIPQPKSAIVHFGDDILQSIPVHIRQRILDSGEYYHYGTVYHDGAKIADSNYLGKKLEGWELERLFGFDMLIYNMDRTLRKPNLLTWNDEYMIIDHELSFPEMIKSITEEIKRNDFSSFYNNSRLRSHLLIPPLKKLRSRMHMPLKYEEFSYSLARLDLRILEKLKERLLSIGIRSDDFDRVIPYLSAQKDKIPAFVKSLNNLF